MAINPYTKTVIQQRQIARADNPVAIQEAAAGAQAAFSGFQVAGAITDKLQQAQLEKMTREETIQRARAVSAFNSEMQNEYARFSQEMDLTDPNAPKEFNRVLRDKSAQILKNHSGSPESKASLEVQLIGLQDSYAARMTEASYGAQKAFIMDTVGTHINRITKEVYDNPESIDIAFAQLNGLFSEYGPALDTVGELEMIDAAQSQISQSALNAFIDAGDYERARSIIDENPTFIEAMTPQQQMSVVGRIQNGLNAQEKERTETRRRINTIRSVATELGVEIPNSQIFAAATGIDATATPQGKVDTFAQIMGKKPEELPASVVAKVAFDIGSGEVDMNKERLPDGGYTPKGIGAQIKAPLDQASAARVYDGKINSAIGLFFENPDAPNSQALLSAMISFQKALDDGAVVRESDLQLMASAAPMKQQMAGFIERMNSGQPINTDMVYQMQSTAKAFFNETLQMSKTQIDPYLNEATQRGYRMIDIGIPRETYEQIFSGVKTASDTVNERRTRVDDIAKQNGMTPEELFEATALASGKSVEQVKKDFGWSE